MDDFVISNLHESRNEWCSRLVSIFTPLVQEGIKSIFNEAWNMCSKNNELDKYLMTFQNLLSRIPKWNNEIIEEERKRIIERSGCNYLEDLITCVHIIQLKVLTCIRVGNKQKKIDISTPDLDGFIHKVYIHTARKLYKNTYLYDKNVNPLQNQKNNREIENIIQECIMMSIRESIPTEEIIRAYMDESVEHEEEVIIEDVPVEQVKTNVDDVKENDEEEIEIITKEEDIPEQVPVIKNIDDKEVKTELTFNDIDSVLNENDEEQEVTAPKSLERLEEISTNRALQRKLDEISDSEEDDEKLNIGEDIQLTGFDVLDDSDAMKISDENIVLNDVEVLE
tara:strand:+ start:1348 stop:2361 length:1014 start_codon:yes stop_codon:yes gene_type:complete